MDFKKTAEEKTKECCGEPMVENGNNTGIRCAKKCGYWEARPPYIKVEIVAGDGIQRGHRAVVFDDTRITPAKVSPCTVEESWAVDVEGLLKNPAIKLALSAAYQQGVEASLKAMESYHSDKDRKGECGGAECWHYCELLTAVAALRQSGGEGK